MNERIRELVGRAEAYAYEHEEHWHDGPDWQELFNKKFAELIVRKSIEVVKDSQGYNQYFPHVAENIKQHFGVE